MAKDKTNKSKKGLIKGLILAGVAFLYCVGALVAFLLTGSIGLLMEMMIVLVTGALSTLTGYGIGKGINKLVTKSSSNENSKSKDRNRQPQQEENLNEIPTVERKEGRDKRVGPVGTKVTKSKSTKRNR